MTPSPKISEALSMTLPRFIVGIDTGVNTGVAVWSRRQRAFIKIESMMIHQAFEFVLNYHKAVKAGIKVIVEDARQVRFKTDAVKMKGAGSVCRDAKAWEDFLTDHQIPFEMVRPNKRITNWTAEQFEVKDRVQGTNLDAWQGCGSISLRLLTFNGIKQGRNDTNN